MLQLIHFLLTEFTSAQCWTNFNYSNSEYSSTFSSSTSNNYSCGNLGCYNYEPDRSCQCNPKCDDYNDCCNDYTYFCIEKNITECSQAPNIAEDRRIDKSKLRIMSYNVEWLFTDYRHSQGYLICPGECEWTTNNDAKKHLEYISSYIAQFNPDILFMEEVSDCGVLYELILNMPLIEYTINNKIIKIEPNNIYKPYLILGDDTYTGQQVGLITKIDPIIALNRSDNRFEYPLNGSKCNYTDYGHTSGCTKHFYTTFNITGLDSLVTGIGVHFKSQPTTPKSCAQREAQASVIADIIKNAVDKGHDIIVTGDFNDYADDILDCYNHIPTSRVTEIIRIAGDLINVINKLYPKYKDYIYSNWYDRDESCIDEGGNERSLIDQFYISKNLYNLIEYVTIDHSYINKCNTYYSDHWPIIVDLNLNKTNSNSNGNNGFDMVLVTIIIVSVSLIGLVCGIVGCYKSRKKKRQNAWIKLETTDETEMIRTGSAEAR